MLFANLYVYTFLPGNLRAGAVMGLTADSLLSYVPQLNKKWRSVSAGQEPSKKLAAAIFIFLTFYSDPEIILGSPKLVTDI